MDALEVFCTQFELCMRTEVGIRVKTLNEALILLARSLDNFVQGLSWKSLGVFVISLFGFFKYFLKYFFANKACCF